MNKMKLLMLLIMAALGMTVSAADAGYEFVESDGGNTLIIRGYGDLTTCSQTDTKTVFAAAANGNVFTNNSGTSVSAGQEYQPSATYYFADREYTPVFNGGAPIQNTNGIGNVYSVWNNDAISSENVYIYGAWLSGGKLNLFDKENSPRYNASITYNGVNYPQYIKLNAAANSNVIDFDESYLLTEAQLAKYITTTYGVNSSNLYISTDNGATKQQLTTGQTYTYNVGDLFYTAGDETYTQIADNATFFAAHPAYLEDAEVTVTFKEALLAKINSGAYTKVAFENIGSGELIINTDIASSILFFEKTSQVANNTITNLDLGQTTLIPEEGKEYKDFLRFSSGNEYTLPNNLTTLTLPLVKAVDNEIVLPANCIPDGYNNDPAVLRTVIVPTGYTKIGNLAFKGRSKVTTVNLPEELKEIGDEAFHDCTALTNINTGAPVEGRSIVFPSKLETIGKSAFENCGSLTSTAEDPFILPSGLKTVKASAFINLDKLKFLVLNEGLKYVGNTAFGLNHEIHDQTAITFPSTIKYLGPGSFISRWYQDIYFTGETAPVCPVGKPAFDDWGNVTAFSANTQMGNNGFNPYPTEGSTADNANVGYANRENYVGSGGYYFTILHFPDGLTDDQAKTYRDITRRYVTGKSSESFNYGDNIAGVTDPATGTPGETFGSAFKEGTTDSRSNLVYYMSGSGLLSNAANADNVQPGYIDTYRGEQQVWPSQMQWTRNYVTVANGVEWDGVTPYRPTLTEEMFEWMKEDGLFVKANGLDYTQGNPRVANDQDNSQGGYELSLADKTYSQLTDDEKDYLSLILYQGTRRFVLGNDSPYKIPFELKLETGRWWSICLPFNMTKAQVDKVFGVGTHVCLFSGVDRTTTGDGKILRLKFTNDVYHHKTVREVTSLTSPNGGNALGYIYGANYSKTSDAPKDNEIVIYARESYMIYPMAEDEDASGVAVRNFGIPEFAIGDPLPTMIQPNSDSPYTISSESEEDAYRFIGNFTTNASYDAKTQSLVSVKIPRYSYGYGTLNGETKFWIMDTDKAVWSPFKSIVQKVGHDFGLDDWNNFFQKASASVKQMSVFGWDEDITGFDNVVIEASSDNGADKAVYRIDGTKAGDSLQGLAPGVYVREGKAYIVE